MGLRWVVVVMAESERDARYIAEYIEDSGYITRVQQEAD